MQTPAVIRNWRRFFIIGLVLLAALVLWSAKELAATVGVHKVRVLHLNDSKKDLGSRVDRHEHIGKGTIGLDGFRPIVRDEAFANIPKILETAKGKDDAGREWDAINLEVLKGLM